jgi:tRNA threonylcarbamoyladenosine biosynthesis protein TsaE
MKITIGSIQQMQLLGMKIGEKLKMGDVVVLTGELGSGKTLLTQGIATALGHKDITSPTFVISRVHKGTPNLVHIDAYRLLDFELNAFTDLDLERYLESSVFVIEWGAKFVSSLTDEYLEIKIELGDLENQRIIEIAPVGKRWIEFKV